MKEVLADAMIRAFAPIRDRYEELMRSPDVVRDVLAEGARRARPVAEATMDEVRRRMGLRGP
jgi:tryptophanyl-tRNA synthetase